MKLLLIEDNLSLRATLSRTLSRRGFEVRCCADGHLAVAEWLTWQPDGVLLDLSLPGQDGLDVLTQARAQGLTQPVIILTARGTVGDRILGLNCGADDYLPKPFDLDELEARVSALLRRRTPAVAPHSKALSSSDQLVTSELELRPSQAVGSKWWVDAESGAIYFQQQVFELPPRELALLRALLARPGQAVSKERLFEAVFPQELEVQPEAIEVVAYRLRKRLLQTGAELVTLRGLGYLLKGVV